MLLFHILFNRLDEENGFGEERTHHQTEELAATARSNLASGKKKVDTCVCKKDYTWATLYIYNTLYLL